MQTNEPVIAVLGNGRGVFGRFIKKDDRNLIEVRWEDHNGNTMNYVFPIDNVFPRTTGGLNDAFERMMELQLQEAKEAVEDGYELEVNYEFVETCKKICKWESD